MAIFLSEIKNVFGSDTAFNSKTSGQMGSLYFKEECIKFLTSTGKEYQTVLDGRGYIRDVIGIDSDNITSWEFDYAEDDGQSGILTFTNLTTMSNPTALDLKGEDKYVIDCHYTFPRTVELKYNYTDSDGIPHSSVRVWNTIDSEGNSFKLRTFLDAQRAIDVMGGTFDLGTVTVNGGVSQPYIAVTDSDLNDVTTVDVSLPDSEYPEDFHVFHGIVEMEVIPFDSDAIRVSVGKWLDAGGAGGVGGQSGTVPGFPEMYSAATFIERVTDANGNTALKKRYNGTDYYLVYVPGGQEIRQTLNGSALRTKRYTV